MHLEFQRIKYCTLYATRLTIYYRIESWIMHQSPTSLVASCEVNPSNDTVIVTFLRSRDYSLFAMTFDSLNIKYTLRTHDEYCNT